MPFNARFACFNNFFTPQPPSTPQRFRNWLHYRSSLLRYRAFSSNIKTLSDLLFILMNRWLASCGMGDVSVKHSHQSLTLKTLINVHFPFTAEFAYKLRHFVFGFHYLSSQHVKGEGFIRQKLPIDSLSVHYLTRNTQLFSCLYCHLTDKIFWTEQILGI